MAYRAKTEIMVFWGIQICFVIGKNLRKIALSKTFNIADLQKESQIQDL